MLYLEQNSTQHSIESNLFLKSVCAVWRREILFKELLCSIAKSCIISWQTDTDDYRKKETSGRAKRLRSLAVYQIGSSKALKIKPRSSKNGFPNRKMHFKQSCTLSRVWLVHASRSLPGSWLNPGAPPQGFLLTAQFNSDPCNLWVCVGVCVCLTCADMERVWRDPTVPQTCKHCTPSERVKGVAPGLQRSGNNLIEYPAKRRKENVIISQ